MVIKKVVKFNRVFLLVLLLSLLASLSFSVGCVDKEEKENKNCTEHVFVRVEDDINRAPTYDKEGRELRKCTVCGISASFVLQKLSRLPATEDEAYLPLLESYTVSYGDSLGTISNKYFTTGWSFILDKETLVGEASEVGYDYTVKYTPSEDKYEGLTTTVRLIVKKAELSKNDVHLDVVDDIPASVNSLEEISIGLLDSQVIKGSVKWVKNQEILRNQVAEYEYIFTPEDTDNYEIYYGKVLLKGLVKAE